MELSAKNVSVKDVFLLASEIDDKKDLISALKLLGFDSAVDVIGETAYGEVTILESPDLYSPDISLSDLLDRLKQSKLNVFCGNPHLNGSFYSREGLIHY